MILDAQHEFSDSQALSTTGAIGTNYIDLGVARSIGNGEPMAVVFTVVVAADQGTGDEHYTFDVEYSSDTGQTTGRQLIGRRTFESGTPDAPAQNADLLVAGFTFSIPLPATNADQDERYLGIRYVLVGTTPLITMDAHLVPMSFVENAADNQYASGFTVT